MKYLCKRHSIKYVEQEESYTSQTSHIHGDFIPTYGNEGMEEISFSGKRENRLYRIPESSYVNADPTSTCVGIISVMQKTQSQTTDNAIVCDLSNMLTAQFLL